MTDGSASEADGVERWPDGIEPIVGWRYWRVDGNALGSLTRSESWPCRRGFEARCRLSGRHGPVPGPSCHCGVYAARDLPSLRSMTTPSLRLPLAVGKVSLWGRVIPAERGYRAQYAYPKRLWLVWESLEPLAQPGAQRIGLAAAYGVPVEFTEAEWALSAEHPGASEKDGRPAAGSQEGRAVRRSVRWLASHLAGPPSETGGSR